MINCARRFGLSAPIKLLALHTACVAQAAPPARLTSSQQVPPYWNCACGRMRGEPQQLSHAQSDDQEKDVGRIQHVVVAAGELEEAACLIYPLRHR
jgi:hypothetical protein